MLAEFQRSGVEEAVYWRVCEHMKDLYTLEGEGIRHLYDTGYSCYHYTGVRPINGDIVHSLCASLGCQKILLVKECNGLLHRRIRLNCSQNELKMALFS